MKTISAGDKLHRKIASLADALELDSDQYDIMIEWFDNNFLECAVSSYIGKQTLALSSSYNIKEYNKHNISRKISDHIVDKKNLLHVVNNVSDRGEETTSTLVIFKGASDDERN